MTCGLWINGKGSTQLVHRLVAKAFIPNPNNYLEINHKDCNKHNNHYSNLEWCDKQQNENHAVKMGIKHRARGSLNGQAILNEDNVKDIRKRWESGEKTAALAKEFGVKYITMFYVVKRINWKHVK